MADVMVNWLAVLVSGIASMVIGGLWYGLLLAKPWMKAMGWTPERAKSMSAADKRTANVGYAVSFVLALIVAAGLNSIVDLAGWTTPLMGVAAGVVVALAFGAASSLPSVIFQSGNMTLWGINTAHNVVSWAVMGAIVASWT